MSEAPINSNKEVPGVGLGRITRFFPLAWRHGSAMSNVGSGGYGPGIEQDPLIRQALESGIRLLQRLLPDKCPKP